MSKIYQSTHTGQQLDTAIDYMLQHTQKVTEGIQSINTAAAAKKTEIESITDAEAMSLDSGELYKSLEDSAFNGIEDNVQEFIDAVAANGIQKVESISKNGKRYIRTTKLNGSYDADEDVEIAINASNVSTTDNSNVQDKLDGIKDEVYDVKNTYSYVTFDTTRGYYLCTKDQAIPTKTAYNSFVSVIVNNIQSGDKYEILGKSGNTSKIVNYFRQGICVERSTEKANTQASYSIVCDGTYDCIVVNSYVTINPYVRKVTTTTTGVKTLFENFKNDVEDKLSNIAQTGLEGKNVVVIGDSSVCGGDNNNQWANKLSDVLGVNVKVFAKKGFTIRYNTSGCLATSMNASFMSWVEEGNTPDIIILQMGGNDLPRMSTNGGSVTEAFAQYNYVSLKNSEMTASSLRYHLELWRRKFPKAIIVVGTVLQRAGATDNTQELAEIQRGIASRLGMYVADCNKEVGFSLYTEASTTNRYKDSTDAVSRTNPYFNYINDATGEVVTQEVATTDGVLNEGYSKRYGLYTYDGTHMVKQGEDVMTRYYANKLMSIARFELTNESN